MEEGASHWSATITIKAFVCAMVSLLTVNIVFADSGLGTTNIQNLFVFGQFIDLVQNETNYRVYELFIFIIIGFAGGLIGALFNQIMKSVTMKHLIMADISVVGHTKYQYVRVVFFTIIVACVSFLLPIMWQDCSSIPSGSDIADWTAEEKDLLDDLVQFQCKSGEYNQLASLYFSPAETVIKQLFHFREYKGSDYATFGHGPLILFFFPYFILSAATSGLPVPSGVFVPSLLAGAAFGRFWGHSLNQAFPGSFADSGTYALVGAAAISGGVTRITVSMTIIMLETSGNMTYLLPLMVTFIAARYTGNVINTGIYDLQIYLKELPFINQSLKSMGLLNYSAVSEIMASPLIKFQRLEKVSVVYEILKGTSHNGFPVLSDDGRFYGLILRKTLCSLLEAKAFSKKVQVSASPILNPKSGNTLNIDIDGSNVGIERYILDPKPKQLFYSTLERDYPNYPDISSIQLSNDEMV
jgi:chloride channel 7